MLLFHLLWRHTPAFVIWFVVMFSVTVGVENVTGVDIFDSYPLAAPAASLSVLVLAIFGLKAIRVRSHRVNSFCARFD